MEKSACVILSPGFEEIEAVAVIDILRRAQIEVCLVSLRDDPLVLSARNVCIKAEKKLQDLSKKLFDVVILPGGEPGATNMAMNDLLATFLKNHHNNKKLLAAICAAPKIFNNLGFLDGKKATSYPSNKNDLLRANYVESAVVVEGNIITSRGPASAMLFAFEIINQLGFSKISEKLQEGMLYNWMFKT